MNQKEVGVEFEGQLRVQREEITEWVKGRMILCLGGWVSRPPGSPDPSRANFLRGEVTGGWEMGVLEVGVWRLRLDDVKMHLLSQSHRNLLSARDP